MKRQDTLDEFDGLNQLVESALAIFDYQHRPMYIGEKISVLRERYIEAYNALLKLYQIEIVNPDAAMDAYARFASDDVGRKEFADGFKSYISQELNIVLFDADDRRVLSFEYESERGKPNHKVPILQLPSEFTIGRDKKSPRNKYRRDDTSSEKYQLK